MKRREKNRDDRDYDKTQLREKFYSRNLSRDYSAHFFRWSFAKRFSTVQTNVLDIGCGQDMPLMKVLCNAVSRLCGIYVGCDLNSLNNVKRNNCHLFGDFNFVERSNELLEKFPMKFDLITHFEVFEHMLPVHGMKMLDNCKSLLSENGVMIMSTPCYDGKHHAANHIHEYDNDELKQAIESSGFEIEKRFGTFMNIRDIGKDHGRFDTDPAVELQEPITKLFEMLSAYYSNDALSCFFAPIYPDRSRNNTWICKHKKGSYMHSYRALAAGQPTTSHLEGSKDDKKVTEDRP